MYGQGSARGICVRWSNAIRQHIGGDPVAIHPGCLPRLMQDNDKKHTSAYAKCIEDNSVYCWKAPPD